MGPSASSGNDQERLFVRLAAQWHAMQRGSVEDLEWAKQKNWSIQELEGDLDHARVVDPARAGAADLVQGGVARERVTVRAPGRQRVVGVGDDDDPGTQGNLVAP